MRKNRFPDNRNGNLPKLGANLPPILILFFVHDLATYNVKYQFGGPRFATSHVNENGSQLRAMVVTFSLNSHQIFGKRNALLYPQVESWIK
jgi:hypothetical protein